MKDKIIYHIKYIQFIIKLNNEYGATKLES